MKKFIPITLIAMSLITTPLYAKEKMLKSKSMTTTRVLSLLPLNTPALF